MKLLDAHIHLDLYEEHEDDGFLADLLEGVEGVIAVSMDRLSGMRNLRLAEKMPGRIWPAIGFHPEQPLPNDHEAAQLVEWMEAHLDDAVAIGEVGLPYYARTEAERAGRRWDLVPYIELLEQFVRMAAERDKPIVLHAVYEDAPTVCDLLEKHGVRRAHFHWFKGDPQTTARIAENGWFVSITPDVAYEAEIRELVRVYPLFQLMAETDGPWPFEGRYAGRPTKPAMVRDVIAEIAGLKGVPAEEAAEILYANTRKFYLDAE